ncbi:FHA domain-containing protein [Bdellovibrio svalbardensis]|uniref:FHA domain-containing protein n=1 Tax=Bdellovibrio svalbardensis TaxID=2972972 RepID=A0ABT6DEH9_9BACT|nr:FHA domain-containing protein [Bdellovibrio svalbardensis]MDG0814892.1 FHA domain-containing protein [Bdellovibrio svalbardensis]
MATFIEIVEGANEGSRIQVSEGMTLGRTKADIIIKDPKVSSTHAEISVNTKDQLVLVDLESSNGIHISGRRVKKVTLLPGVIFEIGRTQFKVIVVEEELAINFEVFVTWRSKVINGVRQSAVVDGSASSKPESFSPALKLQFIQGIQTDEEIILGYGPRQAGADSLDIELLDEEAPREAFELLPGPGMVKIKINAVGRVTLNKKAVDAEILKDGDLISVGTTLIKVSYL